MAGHRCRRSKFSLSVRSARSGVTDCSFLMACFNSQLHSEVTASRATVIKGRSTDFHSIRSEFNGLFTAPWWKNPSHDLIVFKFADHASHAGR